MIGKGHSISRTRESIAYGWNQEKDAEVVLKEFLAGDTPQEIAEEFKIIQSQNNRCINNTLSFVVSPTIEDGKNMTRKDLGEVAMRFLTEMSLKNHQAISFVHRDKEHTHIHIYVNRISMTGETYKDNFIGKRSQIAADNVAREMGLTRVREVQQDKLLELKQHRMEVQNIHERVLQVRPKSLDEYIKRMQEHRVTVISSFNKSNQLQGFRFEFKGINLKGSEIHRSMTGSKIVLGISQNNSFTKLKDAPKSLQLASNTIQLSTGFINKMVRDLVKQTIKRALDTGVGF
ncbi:relaxase/mobilization nuclease domain-containing protein [Salinimicrobium sp. TH3]|uniref:relaxase/mobilization nuclease domain-containing protein n=1 Tax=Salinimicrobium sp. TH3 TaxID=2997342 RepID=UPI002272BE6E|nr:relaxase/mobilization nuclease domain-containing protein [Salinimicrobium sp. TH3]MCY2685924.1 relaxase/mobilization nuclease domain-containing protein [Salinimicrobium sp. TH3]